MQAVGVAGGGPVPPVGWMSGVFPRTPVSAPAVVMVSRSRARDGPVPGPGIDREGGGSRGRLFHRNPPPTSAKPPPPVSAGSLGIRVPFGRKIDDVARAGKRACLEHEHVSGPNLATTASLGIDPEILGKRLLELKCDPTPHDADAVDCVDQGFGVLSEDIASREANHRRPRHQ